MAHSFLKSIQRGFKHLRKGHFSLVWGETLRRLNSTSFSLGLKRNLHQEFIAPPAKMNISVRLMREGDADVILNHEEVKRTFPLLIDQRKGLVNANIPDCYVAVADDDTPCYMQWLISPKHNNRIQAFFGKSFPKLEKDEALLEGAFANPDFRGMGVMPEAMSKIAAKATELGVQWVITFVDVKNIPSLKGCKRAGFSPYILKKSQWYFFRQKVSFQVIPEDVLSQYYQNTGGTQLRSVAIMEG